MLKYINNNSYAYRKTLGSQATRRPRDGSYARTVEKAEKFFKPDLADLHDPFLMKDMDKAVERVERAVRDGEKIMIYGDYDVDGCTAVALVYKFLRQIGHKNLTFYIPDRYTEGHGRKGGEIL